MSRPPRPTPFSRSLPRMNRFGRPARTLIACRFSANTVRTLVQNQLRPGADQSRAEAELAVAKQPASQAVQIADVARASLADAVGAAGASLELAPRSARRHPADVAISRSGSRKRIRRRSPGRLPSTSCVARERTLDRAYLPTYHAAVGVRRPRHRRRGSRRARPLGTDCGCRCRTGRLARPVTFPAFDFSPSTHASASRRKTRSPSSAHYDRTIQASPHRTPGPGR